MEPALQEWRYSKEKLSLSLNLSDCWNKGPKEMKISLESHAGGRKGHQPGRKVVSLEEILEFQQLVSTLQNETEALTRTGSRIVAGPHLSSDSLDKHILGPLFRPHLSWDSLDDRHIIGPLFRLYSHFRILKKNFSSLNLSVPLPNVTTMNKSPLCTFHFQLAN